MTSQWAAVGAETDPRRRARNLQRSWEHLLAEGALGPELAPGATAGLRPTIVESWRRSLAARLDPTDLLAPIEADESEVLERWLEHPLASLTHVLTEQLRKVAEESRGVIVVTDASGLVLHRVGDEWLKERAAEMNLVEGARYSGAVDGTNGIGTALAADHAFQVFGFEHFNERHHEWICSGAPEHDPVSGQTIALIDLSSLWKAAHPRSLELVTTAAEEQNATPYQGSLAPTATCGVDATGVLNVTSDAGGTQPVPVTIPTRRPGPPTTHEHTQTVAIPDDNAGGLVSTLFVPVSGRIKDLNVRLNVAHTFVGDLKVELTSPDNSTTVRLVEHVGGPNNGGDNLVDTVLDDEAPTVIGTGASAAPYTGSFRPMGDQLSRLDGQQQQGTWKLRVSDRYENDTGSLLGWGLTIRTAQCDPNVNARETEIQAAPPSLVGSRNASFQFGSPRPNSQFQCRLDGGDFTPCASPQQFNDLPEGTHTFEVRAFDQYGNVDGSPAIYTWVVDVTAPGPRISSAGGSTPSVSGSAGTASGDNDTVTVDLYSGATAAGSPAQSMVVPRDGGGAWSAHFDPVAGGAYTVVAR